MLCASGINCSTGRAVAALKLNQHMALRTAHFSKIKLEQEQGLRLCVFLSWTQGGTKERDKQAIKDLETAVRKIEENVRALLTESEYTTEK